MSGDYESMSEEMTRKIGLSSYFGLLTAAGAYITIPLPMVPVTAQTFFVLLSGLLLGPKWGAVAMGTYLVIGAAGFPVFEGGAGGIGYFFGPTGGYLIGFVLAAYITGFIAQNLITKTSKSRKRLLIFGLSVAVGTSVIYLFGVPWLAFVADLTLVRAVVLGLAPFLVGDAIKAAASVFVAETLWSTISFSPILRWKND